MSEIVSKQRNLVADFLKGIMIFCVLYGHSISMINGLRGVIWQDSIVNVFVTTFEMPLFILISGYFLWFSLKKKPHFQVLWKRAVSIVLPLLVWEGIPGVYNLVANAGFSKSSVVQFVMRLAFPGLWFLGCYLFCTVLVILVEWALSKIQNKKANLVVGIILYAALIIGLHCIRNNFNNVAFMFPFFLVGFVLSKYGLLNKKGMRNVILGFAVLFVVLYPFYRPEHSFYMQSAFLLEDTAARIPVLLYRFILGLAGCSLFYVMADLLCKKAENSKVVLLTVKLGTKTMELYILSMFIQNYLVKVAKILIRDTAWITDVTAPLVFGPLFCIALTAICLLINYFVEKVPKLHKVMFGR